MDYMGLANSSNKDDEFYLAIKNKRVIYVYNRKMFDFVDEQGNLIDIKTKNKF